MEKILAGCKNKRYLLSQAPIENNALISRYMAYLSMWNQVYVTTPMGTDIIQMPGGGQNYVHGGSSLQEMIIPVTDRVKPRRLQAFFVDADGTKISFPVPITANIKSADGKDRLIQEKFTLKSGRYSRDQEYFLVIADQDDERCELHRYKFEIDISDMSF